MTKTALFDAVQNATLGWQNLVLAAWPFLCEADKELIEILKPSGSGGGGGGTTWSFPAGPLSDPTDPQGTAPAIYRDPVTRFLYFKLTAGEWIEVVASNDWAGPTN